VFRHETEKDKAETLFVSLTGSLARSLYSLGCAVTASSGGGEQPCLQQNTRLKVRLKCRWPELVWVNQPPTPVESFCGKKKHAHAISIECVKGFFFGGEIKYCVDNKGTILLMILINVMLLH
jgi:hypothetical protein